MTHLLQTDFLIQSIRPASCQFVLNRFSGVSLDSRKEVKDTVFFAIQGKSFDGHDFLNQALDKGAKAFVVSNKSKAQFLLSNNQVTVAFVPDTVKALQDLARAWRRELEIKVIAITGSNGKSTTCSFTFALLSDFSVFASPKSYNNFIGAPLSLLNVNKKSSFLVQEIGTSSPGEIAFLTQLCQPVASAVTMIAPAHLEGLKSLSAIAKEKKQIYLNSPNAVWIFNQDNLWTKEMHKELAKESSIGFSFQSGVAQVSLAFLTELANSSFVEGHIGSAQSTAELLFSGRENLDNLMCSCALALSVGAKPEQIWKRIPQCRLPKGRQEWFFMKDKQVSVLFDAYNANPASMDFFLQTCQKFSDSLVLILGDMRELGEDSEKYHRQLAHHPAVLKSRCVFFIGEYAGLVEEEIKKNGFKGQFKSFKTYNRSLLADLKLELETGDLLGLKASRSVALECLAFDLTGKDFLV